MWTREWGAEICLTYTYHFSSRVQTKTEVFQTDSNPEKFTRFYVRTSFRGSIRVLGAKSTRKFCAIVPYSRTSGIKQCTSIYIVRIQRDRILYTRLLVTVCYNYNVELQGILKEFVGCTKSIRGYGKL